MKYDFMIKLAIAILVISIICFFFVEPSSAEFYMLIISSGISMLVLVLSIVIMKYTDRKDKKRERNK